MAKWKQLIAAREDKQFSQAEAAERVNVGLVTYQRWEAGRRKPQPQHMRRLCEVFGPLQKQATMGSVEPSKTRDPGSVPVAAAIGSSQRAVSAPGALEESTRFQALRTSALTTSSTVPCMQNTPFIPLTRQEAALRVPVISAGEWPVASAESSGPASSAFEPITQVTVRIVGLVSQWRVLVHTELQRLLRQEFSMLFQDNSPLSAAGEHGALSRRQALIIIAALPHGLLAAARHTGTDVVAEEFLPQCTASVTACLYLMQGREFMTVEHYLTQYLPALTTLAQRPSPHQQTAAGLASQSYHMLSHLALHRLRFHDRVLYSKQAVEYGQVAGDHWLQALALCTLADAYFHVGDLQAQMQTYQRAARLLDGLPFVSQSMVFGGLAHASAQMGQSQDVERYVSEARVVLTPEARDEPLPLYLETDYGPVQAMQYEGQAWLALGDQLGDQACYQRAADAFTIVKGISGDRMIPERIRVELVNQQAQVAVRQGDLDLFSALLVQGVQGARQLSSEKRLQEAASNWKVARKVWPREQRVMEFADLLLE